MGTDDWTPKLGEQCLYKGKECMVIEINDYSELDYPYFIYIYAKNHYAMGATRLVSRNKLKAKPVTFNEKQ